MTLKEMSIKGGKASKGRPSAVIRSLKASLNAMKVRYASLKKKCDKKAK
jgi:hypothetical protein